jgi:hypothetical protein
MVCYFNRHLLTTQVGGGTASRTVARHLLPARRDRLGMGTVGTQAAAPLGTAHFVIFKNSASSVWACVGVWLSKILSK